MTTVQKTPVLKQADIKADWFIIDAAGQTLGRLASEVATRLIGKHKPSYTPHVVCGDVVVVINAAQIKVSGTKLTDKIYYHHSGYPGGIKEISLAEQLEKNPAKVIEHAVAGMLPKNKLQTKMLQNLKVYAGSEHAHQAQNPVELSLEKESK